MHRALFEEQEHEELCISVRFFSLRWEFSQSTAWARCLSALVEREERQRMQEIAVV